MSIAPTDDAEEEVISAHLHNPVDGGGEIGSNMPNASSSNASTDFTKKDNITQTQVLGVSVKSFEIQSSKFMQSNDLQHVLHNLFQI